MQNAQTVVHLIGQAARLYARVLDRQLRGLGVSSGQAPVLLALAAGNALSQKVLTEIAGVEQSTISATLSRMEKDGLITRRSDPADRRSMLFALTPEAMKEVPAFIEAINDVDQAALIYLDEPETTALLESLRLVVDGLRRS
jgi:MarR family transcriptional regulator for hemolysin